jgi:hypothetical protein
MVRGCQRKVIFLKNTDSKIFSEAYFIVDDRALSTSESDMVREANRIIDENLAHTTVNGERRRGVGRILGAMLRGIPAFIIGAGVAGAICLIFL